MVAVGILIAPLAVVLAWQLRRWARRHPFDPTRGLEVTQQWLSEHRASDR